MLEGLFKKTKYVKMNIGIPQYQGEDIKPYIPSGMWIKCEGCGQPIYKKDLEKYFHTCNVCGRHIRISAPERLKIIADEGSFIEFDNKMTCANPLNFPGYEEKLSKLKAETKLNEGVITGKAKIYGEDCMLGIMDSRFLMGSMGSVVGEKLTRMIERATAEGLPVIIFSASGGARMQEGIFSLMQMAKVSTALSIHSSKGLLYISVLTDPTTGGVTASFAMLGDIILAEPGALIAFAGPRVIEQTIKQKLPEGFQKAEFLLEHGFIDRIVPRNLLKEELYKLLSLHKRRGS